MGTKMQTIIEMLELAGDFFEIDTVIPACEWEFLLILGTFDQNKNEPKSYS